MLLANTLHRCWYVSSPPFDVFLPEFQVRSYSRADAPGTLRRKDEARKDARAERKERKAAERGTKEQELRRLKNLKAAALRRKLDEIAELSGGAALDVVDLDGEIKKNYIGTMTTNFHL